MRGLFQAVAERDRRTSDFVENHAHHGRAFTRSSEGGDLNQETAYPSILVLPIVELELSPWRVPVTAPIPTLAILLQPVLR